MAKERTDPRPSLRKAVSLLADMSSIDHYADNIIVFTASVFNTQPIDVMSLVIGERAARAMKAPDSNVKPLKKAWSYEPPVCRHSRADRMVIVDRHAATYAANDLAADWIHCEVDTSGQNHQETPRHQFRSL